jgi:NADH:quinone reductase (non-electrogenic)
LCTQESPIHHTVKEAIVAGDERGTERIFRCVRNTARVARNTVSRQVVEILGRGKRSRTSKNWSHAHVTTAS